MLLIFSNHLITLLVFFHSFTLNLLTNFEFIRSNMCLRILPISFLDGFMSLAVGWLIKFSLFSFRIIKELPVPFISILSNIFACFANLIPSLLYIYIHAFLVITLCKVIKFKEKIKLLIASKTKDDVRLSDRPCFSHNSFGCIHAQRNR